MEQMVVFHTGEHGVGSMRIPGMAVSKKGTVLAFCEARDGGDQTPTDLVLKRSEDGGKTWGPLQLVLKARGIEAIMDPCPVADISTGTIHLFLNIFPDGDWEANKKPGRVRIIVSESKDDGLTWSSPEDITETVIDVSADCRGITGPGVGVQMESGRLAIPLGLGAEKIEGMIVYSDDHGETWHAGGRTRSTCTEIQVVELSDGKLRLDMRNSGPEEKPKHCRYYAISSDGGKTWSEPVKDPGLVDVVCQGSILRYPFKVAGQDKYPVLFANPASHYRNRINMTVRLSYDDGQSWPVARTVHPGPSAYCCLAALPDGSIGLLYEGGDKDCYECISYARFDMDWLTGS